MYLKYQSEFFSTNVNGVSNTDDLRWRISIFKKTGTGSTINFDTTSDGFTYDMGGSNDSMLAPLKTTSITFNFLLDSANIAGTTSLSIQEEIIDDLLEIRYRCKADRKFGQKEYILEELTKNNAQIIDRFPTLNSCFRVKEQLENTL